MAGFDAGIEQFPPDQRQLVDPRIKQIDSLATGDLGLGPYVCAMRADTISFSGVISPPGTRGTTESPVLLQFREKAAMGIL